MAQKYCIAINIAERHVRRSGKSLRDHLEGIDHAEAWDAMIRLRPVQPLTPYLLRCLHALILRRSQPDQAEQYRTVSIAVSASTLVLVDASAVVTWNLAYDVRRLDENSSDRRQ